MSAGALLPCRGIVKAEWTPTVQQTTPETLSGNTDVIELGASFWSVDYEVDLPKRADFDEWAVFLAERDGADFTFTAPRTFRKYPGNGAIVSDVGVSVSAYDPTARTVTFAGVGSHQARLGDMISYRTLGLGYWTGIVRANATPIAGSVVMSVWPKPVAPHATLAAPRRIEALAEFRITKEPKWTEAGRRRGVSFSAKQVIR